MRVFLLLVAIQFVIENVLCENPYRVIGLAPWNSIDDIKKKCKKLVIKHHPDKNQGDKVEARLRFDRVQKACKEIKEARVDELEGESGFNSALKKCIGSCIVSIVIVILAYFFSMFLFRFFAYTMRFSMILAVTFFVVDSFFAHEFDTEEVQYGATFLIAIFISCLGWIKDILLGKSNQRSA